eukprot:1657809-Alexandrium_andersonii.AAC.1
MSTQTATLYKLIKKPTLQTNPLPTISDSHGNLLATPHEQTTEWIRHFKHRRNATPTTFTQLAEHSQHITQLIPSPCPNCKRAGGARHFSAKRTLSPAAACR